MSVFDQSGRPIGAGEAPNGEPSLAAFNGPQTPSHDLQREVEARFGVLPNFFRLAPQNPEITKNLWGFAKVGYLDNPLPSLFKERLFVYLSRFCEARYCIARHVGFLLGLGRPSGDAGCPTQTVQEVVRLIRPPLARGEELDRLMAVCSHCHAPLDELPASGSSMEEAIFACASHAFFGETRCLEVLKRVFGESRFQHLLVFLAFVRTAHYWTKAHPELAMEDDIEHLLGTYETLSDCVFNDPEAGACEFGESLRIDLASLRTSITQRDLLQSLREAYQQLGERAVNLEKTVEERTATLRQTVAHLEEVSYTITHNMRAPLRAMQGFAGLLGEECSPLSTKGRDYIGRITASANRMDQLITDVLNYCRASQHDLPMTRVDVMRLLREILDCSPALQHPGARVSVEGDGALPALGNEAVLTQCISNILENAVKFVTVGSEPNVRIFYTQDNTHIHLYFQDKGIGIEPEGRERIFQLFQRQNRGYEGAGVGLAIVKKGMERMDGTVTLASEPGHGSTFCLHLRRADCK